MNIIELAKQAYLYSPCVVWTIEKSDTFVTTHEAVHDFAALVEAAARADEREACIKVCEILLKVFLSPQYKTGQPLSSFGERHAVASCVEAIRARGTT